MCASVNRSFSLRAILRNYFSAVETLFCIRTRVKYWRVNICRKHQRKKSNSIITSREQSTASIESRVLSPSEKFEHVPHTIKLSFNLHFSRFAFVSVLLMKSFQFDNIQFYFVFSWSICWCWCWVKPDIWVVQCDNIYGAIRQIYTLRTLSYR